MELLLRKFNAYREDLSGDILPDCSWVEIVRNVVFGATTRIGSINFR